VDPSTHVTESSGNSATADREGLAAGVGIGATCLLSTVGYYWHLHSLSTKRAANDAAEHAARKREQGSVGAGAGARARRAVMPSMSGDDSEMTGRQGATLITAHRILA